MEQSDLDLLQTASPPHLQTLAKLRHLASFPKMQNAGLIGTLGTSPPLILSAEAISELAEELFNPPALAEAIQSLSELDRLILQELVACGGRANSRDLALYLTSSGLLNKEKGQEHPIVPASPSYAQGTSSLYPTPHPHGIFELALRRLLLLGLLFWGKQTSFSGRDYSNGIHDGVLIVPHAVIEIVQQLASSDTDWQPHKAQDGQDGHQREIAAQPVVPITLEIAEGIRTFQRSLYLYWSLVASLREGLPLVNSGLLSRAALRQVLEAFHLKQHTEQIRAENEIPRLLFLRLLLTKLELLQVRQGVLYAQSAPATAFFNTPLLDRAWHCCRTWLETNLWNEILYLPEVLVRPGSAPLDPAHEEVVKARQTVVARVLAEPIDVWHECSTFIARTKLYAPYLLFPRRFGPRAERYMASGNPYGWDFRLRRGWLTHREGWHLVEGGFIRAVLAGPLSWLGLVELNTEENPSSFRLSSSTTLLSSDSENMPSIEESPTGRLIIQPNFELIVLAPVSEALLINLDRFAERVSLEHIAQYRLTKASITRAIQTGLHTDTIQQILEHASGGDIPQNVQYSLGEWERQVRRIELWRGITLLEMNETTLLDTLFADEETRPLFGRRLSPSLAEVAPQQLPKLQEILWQRGHLPALTPAPTQDTFLTNAPLAREPQWRLHDDGLLQPFYAVVDLYLAAEVARISEHDEQTGWRRITAASIQHALSEGIVLEHIVRFLRQYCEDGIPASFLIRLKLWGGGYGEHPTIQIEHAPLLALPESILRDLQADEELKHLLGTEVVEASRLVRVPPNNLERVVELLQERGFRVN